MNNFKFQVEERRQVASFIAQSMTELEIADKLGVNQSTISRDVQALKEMSQSFIYIQT
jgi:IS30 family transposase